VLADRDLSRLADTVRWYPMASPRVQDRVAWGGRRSSGAPTEERSAPNPGLKIAKLCEDLSRRLLSPHGYLLVAQGRKYALCCSSAPTRRDVPEVPLMTFRSLRTPLLPAVLLAMLAALPVPAVAGEARVASS